MWKLEIALLISEDLWQQNVHLQPTNDQNK